MSSLQTHTRPSRGQQTLHESINARRIQRAVTGVHARFELPDDEVKLAGDQDHQYVVLNFSQVEEVIERDGSLEKILEPHHIRIILGTEHDEIIDNRSFQDILILLEVVQPAIYVPDIVYSDKNMNEEVQESAIEAYIYHVRRLQQAIIERDLTIRLISTNKGWTVEHFEMYQDLYEDYDYTELAFYCIGYTGGDAGNAKRKLRRHNTNAIAALGLDNVFLIGRLALEELLRFAPEVKGACGLRKIQNVNSFPVFQKTHERALFANNDQTQSYLDKYE